MVDDPVHDDMVREESDDLHPAALMEATSTARLPQRGDVSSVPHKTGVKVTEQRVLAPLRHRQFFGLDEINEAMRPLREELNDRVMSHLGKSRRRLYEELDRPALRPLPVVPYEMAEWNRVRVNVDFHVVFAKHYYSVPYRFIRREVDLRATAQTIEVFLKGERIASHVRDDTPYQYSTLPEHRPEALQAYLSWNPERFIRWAESAGAARWLHYDVEPLEEQTYRQERRGRPGSAMRWRRQTKTRFRLVWKPIPETIEYDQRIDGISPLVTNRQDLSPLAIHNIFKSKQPLVEKRHDLLKNVLSATPAFLKSVSRLEALLFLVYVSLTVHALIEREVRKRMRERGKESLPLYPEERECRAPTARRILEVFSDLQRHFLLKEGRIVQKFKPELSSIQKQVLSLLGVPEEGYGDPSPS